MPTSLVTKRKQYRFTVARGLCPECDEGLRRGMPVVFVPAARYPDVYGPGGSLPIHARCERGSDLLDAASASASSAPALIPGAVFSTPFESGCLVVSAPDDEGSFDALDSDGVLCRFSLQMVEQVTP